MPIDLWATLAGLDALGFPRAAYAVFGSGPLAARDLRPAGDLDIVVLPALWEELLRRYPVAPKGAKPRIVVDAVEIWPDWAPVTGPVVDLVATADVIRGYRFVNLARVLAWKRALDRPKDRVDMALITQYLALLRDDGRWTMDDKAT